jgi:hypothetical protein
MGRGAEDPAVEEVGGVGRLDTGAGKPTTAPVNGSHGLPARPRPCRRTPGMGPPVWYEPQA